MRVHPLAPVIGLDIDGTLGDYHGHFVWYLENIYYPGSTFPLHWERAREGEFSEALSLSKYEYRAAKLAYRMGGLKRCMPIFQADANVNQKDTEAVRIQIQKIRSLGVQVWICTTRPWLSLTTVDPDTQYWLDQNVGQVDGLIYGQDKYADLIDIVGKERVLGVVDDLPENIERANTLYLKSAIRTNPHNDWWTPRYGAQSFSRISSMVEIVEFWKAHHNGK